MNFTPELLNGALEKYVFRTKLTEKDKEYILSKSVNIKNFDPKNTLEYLIENSEGRLDIYEPADELLEELTTLVAFPNNSEFLGICGNRVNLEDDYWIYTDRKNNGFLLKSEVPLFLFRNLKSSHGEVSIHLLKTYVHKLYRILKNTLEFIPENTVTKMYEEACQAVEKWKSKFANQYTVNDYNFIDYTAEEVYSTISKFYEAESDQEFLIELQEQLKITAQNLPVNLNLDVYEGVLLNCHYIEQFMKYARHHYMHIFVPKLEIDKSFPHFRVIRVFELSKKKYVFVKDLEFALMNYEHVKIDVETEEERKNGIVLTMEYQKFENYLKQAGITENDMNIIPSDFEETKHDVNVPILTSYGTHCKLAEDAFSEVFRVFSLDINWFNTVSEKNWFKISDWFNSHLDVFSDSREGVYCIEIWKIEQLKNLAYEQMKKYTRKPKYEPPNIIRSMTKNEMYEEMRRFGNNHEMDDECLKRLWLHRQKKKEMSKWDVLVMYDDFCQFQLTIDSSKMSKFVSKHVYNYVLDDKLSTPQIPVKSMTYETSLAGNECRLQRPKFNHKLDAHLIRFSNEYVYSISTMYSDCFYQNDTCLKLALDKTIQDESVKSKIISLVYEAEIQKFEKQRRSLFYLNELEFYTFCQRTKKKFNGIMEENHPKSLNSAREGWKTHFPIDQYSDKFHDSVQEILKNDENSEELVVVGLKARKIFEEFAEKMRYFKNHCKDNKERTIAMRIMSEIRIDNFEDWHMFSEEVLEAIEIVLENEGRLEAMKEKVENWRNTWNNGGTFSTITVKFFKTILNVAGIEQSKFVFMPDTQFFRNFMKLPLKMGYNAIKILSPDGREVYHQNQGQFLIFQYGACDVFWNSENRKHKMKQKKKVLEEIRKIGKGYTLAKRVEESVEMLKHFDFAQKTPLSALHFKNHEEFLTNDELRGINHFLPNFQVKLNDVPMYQCKALLMGATAENVWKNEKDDGEVKKNILRAFTMNFGFMYMADSYCVEHVCRYVLRSGFLKAVFKLFEMIGKVSQKGVDIKEPDGATIKAKYMLGRTVKLISTANIKNESARATYDSKELVEPHYLFDEKDQLGTLAKEKKKVRNSENKEAVGKSEEIMTKILNLIPKVIVLIPDDVSESIDKLWELFEDYIQKEFDEEEAVILCKVLRTKEGNETMKLKLLEQLDFTYSEGLEMYRWRKIGDLEKKGKPKKEEGPRVVVKYVTETKTVENCINCRNIEKETMDFMKKIEKLERENEEYQRIIRQNEEDLAMLKSQIGQNKLKYRDEIQKHKEDVESREAKIEQLHQEIKEYREDSRIERENVYAEVRKSSRIAEESVKKMKIELENSKFLETAKNKKIDELTTENRQLKTSLEIAEEKVKSSENRCDLLEKQSEDMTLFFTDSIFEEDLYLDSDPNIGPFEEILRFDVYEILKKISHISEKYGISNSEIVRFQRRYELYIRIVENENCWEKAEIPDFPIPFSAELMQNYERCLKENFMEDFLIEFKNE